MSRAAIVLVYVFQRMFGSMPLTTTRSWGDASRSSAYARVAGQTSRLVPPSLTSTWGRCTWKS